MARALTATAAVSSASTAHDTLIHSENLHFYLFIYIFSAPVIFYHPLVAKVSIFLNVLQGAIVPQDGILRHLSHAHQLPAHCLLPLLACLLPLLACLLPLLARLLPLLARANVGAPTFYS